MIASGGKQVDKQIETSIVHVCHRGITEVKILFLKGKTALWLGKESVQSVTMTMSMQPFGQR